MSEPWKQWEGQTVNGEFRLGEYLGGSTRGAVFQLQSGNPELQSAAIKLIAEDSPDAENRFASWRFAAKLSHPNLLRIFQSGRCRIGDTKLLFVVMERADEDLSQIIPSRPLTEYEAGEVLRPALDALAYLHADGLVHGRIKPSNIMASGDQLKLSSDAIRRAGEAIGEPGDYDPPEAARSSAGDVWSLGVTLVYALTQRLPVRDRTTLSDPVVPGNLPAALLDIARHCLRRDPARRFAITDIASRLKSPSVAARIEPPVARTISAARSWYLILAVILLLASASVLTVKLVHSSAKHRVPLAQQAKHRTERASPESRPAGSAAAPEKEPATLSAKKIIGGDLQAPLPAPSAPAPAPARKSPEVAAAGGVLHQVLPDVPQSARDTIRGTVRVGIKVSVDPSGSVTDAAIDSPGPSAYFANLALQAARRWKFAPSPSASSDWTLRFEFTADDTQAFAAQSAP